MLTSWNFFTSSASIGARIANAAVCMGADTVIDISNEIWDFYTFNATKGVLKSMAKLPLATDADYIAWLRPSLGYDGVILDQKGDLFLACFR